MFKGEGRATRKWDGSCCKITPDGGYWKRREVKDGKPEPGIFELEQQDPITGKKFGWTPVGGGAEDKYFREAIDNYPGNPPEGTYELVGPKVQGNPDGFDHHALVPHGKEDVAGCPIHFIDLEKFFAEHETDIEGIVWWHEDGRKAKIKAKDFGLTRRPQNSP